MENYEETIEKILSLISNNNSINYNKLLDKKQLISLLKEPVKLFFNENPFLLTDANIELICDKYENFAYNAFNTYVNYQFLYDALKQCDNILVEIINKETINLLIELNENSPEPNNKLKIAHQRYTDYLNGK